MAKKKISGLPAGSALNGTELVPIVQAGTTKRTTAQDIANLGNASGVDGSGTINKIPKFTASSTIGNSGISDDGTDLTLDYYADGSLAVDATGKMKIEPSTMTMSFGESYATNLKEYFFRNAYNYAPAPAGYEYAKLIQQDLLNTASLILIPSAYKTGKVAVSKPTIDLDFTRSNDTATRVNEYGLIEKVRTNLVLYSEQFNDAYWVKTNTTVVANSGIAPNGTTTAELVYPTTTGSNRLLEKSFSTSASTPYTGTWHLKASGLNWVAVDHIDGNVGAWFNLSTGTIGTISAGTTASIENLGNGWYRCRVSKTSGGTTGYQDIRLVDGDNVTSVTANGTDGVLVWGAQAESGDIATDYIPTTTAAVSVGMLANVPRMDYTNGTPSLLLEPQRINVALYSEQFNNAYWLNSGLTLSANSVTSPDGYINADTATETATTSQHGLSSGVISFISGTNYTFSVFAKNAPNGRGFVQLYGYQLGAAAANVFANFDINTGVVGTLSGGTSTITNYGNGWYRCTFTFACGNSLSERINLFNVTSASAASGQSYVGDITKAIYWYGAQVEVGAYASSYIPTLGASVTRGVDSSSTASVPSLIGQTEGTMFFEFNRTNTFECAFFMLSNLIGTTPNAYQNSFYFLQQANGTMVVEVYISAVPQVLFTVAALSVGTHKMALAYKANDFALYVDGVQLGTDTSGSVPTTNFLSIGGAVDGGPQKQAVNQALLFPTRLTNAELATLTTI
jgi:hypothetical protein